MKKSLLFIAIAAIALLCNVSCKTTNEPKNAQMVDVNVSFAGLDVEITPENAPRRAPMASDKNATQAKVTRLALSIFDATADTLVKSITETSSDAKFGQDTTFRLRAGSYKFVAVAHAVANSADPVATISSVSAVSFGTSLVANPTYTMTKDVTISGNTTQSVTMDFGTRKNATFEVAFTDANPDDVKKLQMIVAPASTAYTDLTVDPATGFAASQWKYTKSWTFANLSGFVNTKGKNFALPVMLTAASQQLDVTINALSATDEVLYTRTLQNVTLQQAHRTLATGTFFSPSVTTSFTFDITEITDNISLD